MGDSIVLRIAAHRCSGERRRQWRFAADDLPRGYVLADGCLWFGPMGWVSVAVVRIVHVVASSPEVRRMASWRPAGARLDSRRDGARRLASVASAPWGWSWRKSRG